MTFVLVHGGGFSGSCWDRTLPHLEAPAVAIDLPGRGKRPADLNQVQAADWILATIEEVQHAGEDPVLLVGHSLAGITLPAVAAAIPERIRRLVFVSCTIPPNGGCVLDTLEPEVRAVADRGIHQQTSGLMDDALARASFCNDMNEALARETLAQMIPEAMEPITAVISTEGIEDVPRTYIKLAEDTIVTPEMQEQMIRNLGHADAIELQAGHMAMISQPEALAAVLNQIHASD
ncbi:alpha/beta fold hydrolase [Myxococcota bacterium]|nr:alpha/beta fold hydrolase [Myxococcota bacterium]